MNRVLECKNTNISAFLNSSFSCSLAVILLGVKLNVFVDKTTHFSISTSGKSEKSKMHSLNPEVKSRSLSCVRTERPICKEYDEFPSSTLSQRWRILYNGKTSGIEFNNNLIKECTRYTCKQQILIQANCLVWKV